MLHLAVYPLFALVVKSGTVPVGTLRISEAGLGTLNLPLGDEKSPAAAEALAAAVAAGCNFVDTAEAYAATIVTRSII